MSLIVGNGNIVQSKGIGYEIYDDNPVMSVTYSIDYWTRPLDWISVPNPATSSEVVYMLVGVYDNAPNFLTIRTTGTCSVDWGDGSTQSISSGSYARKEFNFGSYSVSTLTSEGFKQALVTVTPQTSGTLTSFDISEQHSFSTSYTKPNVLEIKMSGPNLTSLNISNTSIPQFDKLTNFVLVGTHSISSFNSTFYNCRNLRSATINCLNSTNTASMFQGCTNLRDVNISNLNSVTTMNSMFQGCYSLRTLPAIDANACTTFASMFSSCISLVESPTINNSSLVTDTQSMFSYCYMLKKVNLFTTSAVTNMNSMFYVCYVLENVPLFTTSAVTNMNAMFYDCRMLTGIPAFNTGSLLTMRQMFYNCRKLISDRRNRGLPYLNLSNVTDMYQAFVNCYKIKMIPHFDTGNVTNMESLFSGCILLSEVPLLNTSKVTTMQYMFYNCKELKTVPLFNTVLVINMSYMFQFCRYLSEVPLFNTAAVTQMQYMFDVGTGSDAVGCLYTIPLFNTQNVTRMDGMFRGQYNLNYIPTLNTSVCTNMSEMFRGCYSLKELQTLNMSLVTNSSFMFYGCTNLRKVGDFNIPLNTTMYSMFNSCINLQSIGTITTTSALTSIRECFSNCYNLKTIPYFETVGIGSDTNGFYYSFSGCNSLESLPYFNTTNVKQFNNTFNGCQSLRTIPGFTTSNVTTMSSAFVNCYSLESVPVFNLATCSNISSMFQGCINITAVTFSNDGYISNGYQAFYGCSRLKSISFSPNNTFTNVSSMFYGCNSLKTLGTFSVNTPTGIGGSGGYYQMFSYCTLLDNIDSIVFSSTTTQEFRYMFNGCNSLTVTPTFSMVNSSGSAYQASMFSECYSLSKVNATASKYALDFTRCNLNYNNILNMSYGLTTSVGGVNIIGLYENPGLPEMMSIHKRLPFITKGYTFSSSGSYTKQNWEDLKLYVQVGDTYSYSGTGTTIYDICGSNYYIAGATGSNVNGSLINTPTYNTNNFEFNGIDETITFGTASETLLSTVTLFAVVEPVTLPSGTTMSIIGRYGSSGNDNYYLDFTDGRLRFGFKQTGVSTRRERILNKTFNVGQKYLIVARHQSGASNCIVWVDAVQETSWFSSNIGSETMDQTSSSVLSIASNYAAGTSYGNIKIYAAGIYNRLLGDSQVEELQSFFRRQGIL